MHPKVVGDRTEAIVMAALVQSYRTVLVPFGENQRYDFVVEDADGVFRSVQCKTGRLRQGAVLFNACSLTIQGERRGYRGEVDYFGIYCSGTDSVYLVPVDEAGTREGRLRVDKLKRASSKTRWAKDYLLMPLKS